MQEFSSISVSSYEAGSLAERLTEQSRDGWHVVAVVPTGSTITAYLCREADSAAATSSADAATTDEPAESFAGGESAEPAADEPEPVLATTAAAITPEPASEPAPEPVGDSLLAGLATAESAADANAPTEPTSEGSTESTSEATTTATASDTAAAATAGAAPAGWYADPSGRFELRYWDGGQWTEHVSRAGQQYTDPPVA
jgi:hypothetical protein